MESATRNKSAVNPLSLVPALLSAALASAAFTQPCPKIVPKAQEIYPTTPLKYPLPSDRYSVKYKIGTGGWTSPEVYISYYGATKASPYHPYSNYPSPYLTPPNPNYLESMSFASIPVASSTPIIIRVTKRWGSPFPSIDHISVRPAQKPIKVDWVSGYTVQLSTTTAEDFLGEQFVLWWDLAPFENSKVEGLGIFLDPLYIEPASKSVKLVKTYNDLTDDLSTYDTLDIEGNIIVDAPGHEPEGAQTFLVPANIKNVFLGPGTWFQGKIRFEQSGAGRVRRLYGPGVIDASRFDYRYRQCRNSTIDWEREYGYQSISWTPFPTSTTEPALPDRFILDGIIATDGNYYATDWFENSALNNIKIMSWNGNNDGIQFGLNSSASNVFLRVADDSLKMWGAYINVTNATVWQNFNGGVINLGWSDNTPGDGSRIDGVYVVNTDWQAPSTPSWNSQLLLGQLNSQNNAIVDSMMIPGTRYGTLSPPVFRNIHVQEEPWVLFSLKILPPDCGLPGAIGCPKTTIDQPGYLNLNIQHLFAPASKKINSIGFQNVDSSEYSGTLFGEMNIALNDVNILSGTSSTTLTSANAKSVGIIRKNGSNVNIDYTKLFLLNQQWFSAWAASPESDLTGASLSGSTVRMIVRPTISGTNVRVKIENTEGQYPVEFAAAYIGEVQSGAALVFGTNTQLTFNGDTGLSLPAGGSAFSDPLPFAVTAFKQYAVSLDVTTATDISTHRLGLVTNYIANGFLAANSSATDFNPVPKLSVPINGPSFPIYWVSALDVESPTNTGTIVALGDSITDGYCSTRDTTGVVQPDVYNRWTDHLATRMASLPAGHGKAVVDEGIVGNTIVGALSAGPPALVRMNNDVFSREGVTHVILFEGTNDLGTSAIDASAVIAADEQLIARAHTAGIYIIGATITPRGADPSWTSPMEIQRVALNEWIRNQAAFDGIIDFDSLMQGTFNTINKSYRLATQWSCGDKDGVHPNAAGYAVMSQFIDLSLFSKP